MTIYELLFEKSARNPNPTGPWIVSALRIASLYGIKIPKQVILSPNDFTILKNCDKIVIDIVNSTLQECKIETHRPFYSAGQFKSQLKEIESLNQEVSRLEKELHDLRSSILERSTTTKEEKVSLYQRLISGNS